MPQYRFKATQPTDTRNKCYYKSCHNVESCTGIFTHVSNDTVFLLKPLCKDHAELIKSAIEQGATDTFFFYNPPERG